MRKMYPILLAVSLALSNGLGAAVTTEPVPTGMETVVTNTINDVVVEDALMAFKSLTRVEKKAKMKEVKKLVKDFKAIKKAGGEVSTNQVLLGILCVILPPLAVGLHEGSLNGKFWLSVLLTLLFWLPGIIYALIVVFG